MKGHMRLRFKPRKFWNCTQINSCCGISATQNYQEVRGLNKGGRRFVDSSPIISKIDGFQRGFRPKLRPPYQENFCIHPWKKTRKKVKNFYWILWIWSVLKGECGYWSQGWGEDRGQHPGQVHLGQPGHDAWCHRN